MKQPASEQTYEVVIEPDASWVRIDWRALWEYRDLLVLFVRREFLSKYKQTILGPAWFVINPLLTTIVFTVVFGQLLGWNYFSQVVSTGSAVFQSHATLFSKVYFPRLTLPLSVVFSTLCALALQLVTFFGFFIYYKLFVPAASGLSPSWHLVFLPLLIIQVAALSLGVTLWMSAVTAKYRDLIHVNQFLMQLWMYATPIIYPISRVPAKWLWLVWLNPMCSVVESFRLCLLGRGAISGPHLAASVFSTLVILFSGVMIYQKTERTVADIA